LVTTLDGPDPCSTLRWIRLIKIANRNVNSAPEGGDQLKLSAVKPELENWLEKS